MSDYSFWDNKETNGKIDQAAWIVKIGKKQNYFSYSAICVLAIKN